MGEAVSKGGRPWAGLLGILSAWLTVLVPLSPLFVGWTFLLGRLYTETYYGVLGVNIDYLRPDNTTFLLMGAVWQLSAVGVFAALLIMLILGALAIALAFVVLALGITAIVYTAFRIRKITRPPFRELFNKTAAHFGGGLADEQPDTFLGIWRQNKAQIVLGLVCFGVLSFMTVHDMAKDVARKDVEAWTEVSEQEASEIQLRTPEGRRRIRGRIVACGEDACAIRHSGGFLQVPRESILWISSRSPSD